jgi:hypothetical protein
MRVARAKLQRGAPGVPARQEPPHNWNAPAVLTPADVIWKTEVDQLSSHPTRHAVGCYQLDRQVSTRLMVLTYVRYQCNGFSCLNSASR